MDVDSLETQCVRALAEIPDPVSVRDIRMLITPRPTEGAVLRALAELVDAGRVAIDNRGLFQLRSHSTR
ncbi:hypothetical protein [Agromyces larvae]|uniref:DprA winged helix domain-containing protein n=1 Tax=Agromyces larvae TaxID=2929802 RepID=A0ABY4C1Y1_9MICO|nr:hypothetical protein [Agromyces larvae]UOE45486.1 hypothetical protein MTO99_06935 [Agromyces larvae]